MSDDFSSDSLFPETRWSLVAQAMGGEDEQAKQALKDLLKAYWPPIFSALKYGYKKNDAEAKRLCDAFLSHVINQSDLTKASESGRPLREYLKHALDGFMSQAPGSSASSGVDINPEGLNLLEGNEPQQVFDENWTLLLMQNAVNKTQSAFTGDDEYVYRIFERVDVEDRGQSLQEIANDLEIEKSQVQAALFQARRRFRRHLIEEIHEYALDQTDAKQELRWLLG